MSAGLAPAEREGFGEERDGLFVAALLDPERAEQAQELHAVLRVPVRGVEQALGGRQRPVRRHQVGARPEGVTQRGPGAALDSGDLAPAVNRRLQAVRHLYRQATELDRAGHVLEDLGPGALHQVLGEAKEAKFFRIAHGFAALRRRQEEQLGHELRRQGELHLVEEGPALHLAGGPLESGVARLRSRR